MSAKVYFNWMFTSAGKLGEPLQFEVVEGKGIKELIDEVTSQNKIVIFSKTISPHCHRAKKIFDELNEKYKVVEVNKLPQMSSIQDTLNEMTGARTVPRVFVNGKCIGGGAETAQLLENGELKKQLEQAS